MQGNILIAILFFYLCGLNADQTISTKDFVHKLSTSLDKSEKLDDLVEVYRSELYGDVGFTDDKPVMSYLAVHSDMEKRKLPAEIEKDYKKRKEKFKHRLSLVPTKKTYSAHYSEAHSLAKHEATNDLEMYYAEFIRKFLAYHRDYFRNELLLKIKSNLALDHADKAIFWMLFASTNLFPFQIQAKQIDIQTFTIEGTSDLIIFYGEEEDTGIVYVPYYYNRETQQIFRCTSDKGEPITFLPSYNDKRDKVLMNWKDSILTCNYQGHTSEYTFSVDKKTWRN
jgi:hypothetical protein